MGAGQRRAAARAVDQQQPAALEDATVGHVVGHHRRVEVDVHFRLLPTSDPKSFEVDELIERSVPIPDRPFSMLDPVDRVLHTVVNLARTGEFRRAYRDLWDLRCLTAAAC